VVGDEIPYPLMLPLRKILQQVVVGERTRESEEGRLNNNGDQEKRNMHEESDDIVRIVAFAFIFYSLFLSQKSPFIVSVQC